MIKKKGVLLIFGLLLVCTGYSQNPDFDYYKNGEIPDSIRTEIQGKASLFLKAFVNKDSDIILNQLASDTLKTRLDDLSVQFDDFATFYDGKGLEYLNEYYLPRTDSSFGVSIFEEENTNYEYELHFGVGKADTYISLFTLKEKRTLFGLIFRRFTDTWVLDFMGYNGYSIYGKLPYDFYVTSMLHYQDKHLTDAAADMHMAKLIMHPNNFFRYTKEEEMMEYSKKLDRVANRLLIFPRPVFEISSNPMIISLGPAEVNDTILYSVSYMTELPPSNSKRIEKENLKLHSIIGDIYPGFDKNNPIIHYAALVAKTGEIIEFIRKNDQE